ncbi:hypothetical protein JOB18_009913 [Solea senegalensis]|uniref:Uncharacterized protein n=1 Tax=Solea senegalensis TaxID=28829 RepID=A0AAV6R1Z5_SOLSE|nr:hypothetical protein JOB18_009913 [Solea senegalensis]
MKKSPLDFTLVAGCAGRAGETYITSDILTDLPLKGSLHLPGSQSDRWIRPIRFILRPLVGGFTPQAEIYEDEVKWDLPPVKRHVTTTTAGIHESRHEQLDEEKPCCTVLINNNRPCDDEAR